MRGGQDKNSWGDTLASAPAYYDRRTSARIALAYVMGRVSAHFEGADPEVRARFLDPLEAIADYFDGPSE